MAIDEQRSMDERLEKARRPGSGIGLLKGMLVTLKHLFKHNTVIQYPNVKQDLPPRTRGVIALKEENCTVCMLCGRECPDWCIYIDSHKETLPPKREGGRPRKRNVLDRFAIDYALCMYCGICVEVCPYDALFWSREFEYAEYDIRELTHEKEKLSDWMATVLPPPPLEQGALLPGQPEPEAPATAQPAAAATTPATTARPATATSSAAEARPEQAAEAPKAPTAAPTAATEATPAPAATTEVQAKEEIPAAKAETEAPGESPAAAEPEVVETPTPAPTPIEAAAGPDRLQETTPLGEPMSSEESEAVYKQVLEEQLAKGSSPTVAEARARVARAKAERGIGRPPTPIAVEKPVPSAPTKAESKEPTPSGAPRAEEPQPPQGPVAPTPAEEKATPPPPAAAPASAPVNEDPEAAYERVLAEERAKGSSEPVATARAKAARVRAQKGTKGPA
jgi:formate hydrogenlyase subunit 6/NADH:ubiquinone oxidoreductase subunit I